MFWSLFFLVLTSWLDASDFWSDELLDVATTWLIARGLRIGLIVDRQSDRSNNHLMEQENKNTEHEKFASIFAVRVIFTAHFYSVTLNFLYILNLFKI